MSRILLVHWNEQEARERAQRVRAQGHQVRTLSKKDEQIVAKLRANPPDLFLIDLSRQPAQGREVGSSLRRRKLTRRVPILFVGGEPEGVLSARRLLPDALFAEWSEIQSAIKKALRNPPLNPLVPNAMAGYSGTPLPKKLGIRENYSVALIHAPENFARQLEPLPPGSEFVTDAGRANVVVLFALSEAELARDLRPLAKAAPQKCALWIAWPKQASGVSTDLKENLIREFGLGEGWVDYKICAINQTWSGLCFARKKQSG